MTSDHHLVWQEQHQKAEQVGQEESLNSLGSSWIQKFNFFLSASNDHEKLSNISHNKSIGLPESQPILQLY
jgi:hypothetical protein